MLPPARGLSTPRSVRGERPDAMESNSSSDAAISAEASDAMESPDGGMCSLRYIFTLDSHETAHGQMLLLLFIASLAVFTTVSNIVTIHLTRTSSELKALGPLRALIGSMACADLLVGIIVMPGTGHQYILKEWLLGHQGCKLFIWSSGLATTASIFHLCAIAVDRYLAIIHPLAYKRMGAGTGYTLGLISAAWMLSLGIAAPVYAFDLAESWGEGARWHCDVVKSAPYVTLFSSCAFSIPFCLMWAAYLRIYCTSRSKIQARLKNTLKTYHHVIINTSSEKEPSKSDSQPNGFLCMVRLQPHSICSSCQAKIPLSAEKSGLCKVCRAPNNLMTAAMEARIKALMFANRRLFVVTLIITSAFTICFIPMGVRFQAAAFCPDCQMSCALSNSMTWLGFSNSALNPVIYTVFNYKFRRAFKKLIGC